MFLIISLLFFVFCSKSFSIEDIICLIFMVLYLLMSIILLLLIIFLVGKCAFYQKTPLLSKDTRSYHQSQLSIWLIKFYTLVA